MKMRIVTGRAVHMNSSWLASVDAVRYSLVVVIMRSVIMIEVPIIVSIIMAKSWKCSSSSIVGEAALLNSAWEASAIKTRQSG